MEHQQHQLFGESHNKNIDGPYKYSLVEPILVSHSSSLTEGINSRNLVDDHNNAAQSVASGWTTLFQQHLHSPSLLSFSTKSFDENKRLMSRGLLDTQDESNNPISEQLWIQTLQSGSYLNYTFYISSNGISDSVKLPNCTIDVPCSTIAQLLKAIEDRVFTPANNYFIYSMSTRRFVLVNVIVMDEIRVECSLTKNAFTKQPVSNLMYMFRFTSFDIGKRSKLICNERDTLFQTTRYDLLGIMFAHINLESLIIRNDYLLNFGMHHCSVFLMDVINTDTKYQKYAVVEYCKLEYFGIAYLTSNNALFKYSSLKSFNAFRIQSCMNLQLFELDVTDIIKADFNTIQQCFIRNSRFVKHSTVFFISNTNLVEVRNCYMENQNGYGVPFTVSKGSTFQFINNFVKGGLTLLDVKAQDKAAIINCTIIGNEVMEDKSKFFDLFFNYNSVINIRSTSLFYIGNSTFDNNYGTKGSHTYLQDVIEFQVESSRFLNGRGSALYIDTTPTTDLDRFLIRIRNSLFDNNVSNDYGGALRILYSINLALYNCIFRNNIAKYSGGAVNVVLANAIFLNQTIFERNRVIFDGRTSDDEFFHRGAGGALAIDSVTQPMDFEGARFIENEAYAGGALFYNFEGIAKISNTIFRKNRARNTGGAIFHFAPFNQTVTTMENVIFDQNIAQVYGNDYFTSVNEFGYNLTTLSIYPGKTIFFPMITKSGGVDVPCNVDHYILDATQYPNVYFHVNELTNGMEITMLIKNGTISEYAGIRFNATIRVSQSYENSLFSYFIVLPCPSRYEYKFSNMFDIPAFACVFSSTLTWEEVISIAIPAGVAFFIMGGFSGLFVLYLCLHITRRLRRLSTKEKAEKAVAQKIIDKRIVFGSDYEPSRSNDTFYYDTLSSPLLASNEVEMKISRRVNNFLIPIEALEIVSKIAEGGQGVVYKALMYGKTNVAVKSLKKFLSDGNNVNDADDEFEKEVSVLASLKHQNILKFYGISVTDDSKYMVTEYLENGSLERMIYKCRIGKASLTLKQKLVILQDICSGLEYLHSLDPPIVHRDLKPGNVLFDSDYKCKICDFGLSRSVGNLNSNNTMTKNIGTFLYSSPESWTGSSDMATIHERIMRATKIDVFSFGVMMYELFFEVSPYSQSSKVGGSENDSIPVINILAHIVQGNRPIIPFHNLEQVREWLQIYPLKPYELTTYLCQIVLDYCEMTRQCWRNQPQERPSFKEIGDELKRLTFELSANCE